jgi:outer membrane protein OmpA-like peptidoglycan-associated protein
MPAPAPVVAAPPRPEPVMVTPTPAPPMPIEANIATARSGAVPFSDIKSPPFGGPMQVAVIQFGRASSGLGENDYNVLAQVAQIQRRNGGTVRVVAHADQDAYGASATQIERGNFEVSRRRALAVAQQLRALGVPRDRIVAEAASDDEPVYQTNTARGIAANRRAEVFIDF